MLIVITFLDETGEEVTSMKEPEDPIIYDGDYALWESDCGTKMKVLRKNIISILPSY